MDTIGGPFLSAAADTPDLPEEDFDRDPIPEPGEPGRADAIERIAREADPRSSAQLSEEL
ncbi:hypothetical protein ACSRUE_16925 [Sorangium sp. KYC3313]|uniref:hypothetical protein n=1 Tax=Sorangium sp. KYC3313 TaxID=3449740 RepID=UPI003F8BA4C5